MAVIKCKMCGGDLNIIPGESVAECEYCGSRQTVPAADNEKKLTLFARANRLRSACEFDKAAGIYESIVADFPEEAEAYWGLVLCKYGIEYVDDPATGKKIPTCHRSSFDSILEDSDFDQVCENADTVARKVYREEAKQIEGIRRGIIEVSGREQPYDIFICYKETDENGERTLDSVLAQDVYDALTAKGYRVFFSRITLEDKLGQEYEPYIFAALNSAKIMLAFGTDYEYFNAVWVKNEWSRYLKLMASDKTKHLIPCYKGLDAYDMPREFAKLQAQDMGKVGAMQDLLRGIEKLLPKKQETAPQQNVIIQQTTGSSNAQQLLKRGYLALEDGEWEKADSFFEEALNQNAEYAEAYLGKLMVELRVKEWTALGNQEKPFENNGNYKKAIRFGSKSLRAELTGYNNANQRYIGQGRLVRVLCERKKQLEQLEREARKRQEQLERKERERQEHLRFMEIFTQLRSRYAPVQNMVSAGNWHTVGLKSDGTAVAVGTNKDGLGHHTGQREVSNWKDIVAISAGNWYTVGLKADGTVVAVGRNKDGECDVSAWTDIVAVSVGGSHTIGLKSDGTVVAVGRNKDGECDVSAWTDIVAVSVGGSYTVGLKSDGNVVAVGSNMYGQCDVSDWTDIVAVSAGNLHTVGLKSDGTVVAVGDNSDGQCDVSDWTDIVAVSAGTRHTVGLKSNGTVVAVGNNYNRQCAVSGWRDIVAISAGFDNTVGLKADGSVVAVGQNKEGQCDVSDWKLFQNLETIEEEREKARLRREKEAEEARKREEQLRAERKTALEREKTALQTELANLRGLFTGKRRREIEAQLAEIDSKLKALN